MLFKKGEACACGADMNDQRHNTSNHECAWHDSTTCPTCVINTAEYYCWLALQPADTDRGVWE